MGAVVCFVSDHCLELSSTVRVGQIVDEGEFGATVKGWKTKTYHLRFGGWHTELYLELDIKTKTYRWWVWAFDNASPNPLKERRDR